MRFAANTLHGHPRYTKDVDVWIELSPINAARIVRALEQFGFGSLQLQPGDFLEPDQIIQLGYPPNRIDLINLRKNKQATARLQDLADLEALQ